MPSLVAVGTMAPSSLRLKWMFTLSLFSYPMFDELDLPLWLVKPAGRVSRQRRRAGPNLETGTSTMYATPQSSCVPPLSFPHSFFSFSISYRTMRPSDVNPQSVSRYSMLTLLSLQQSHTFPSPLGSTPCACMYMLIHSRPG